MSHQDLGRILLAIFCILQGAATLAIDLNRTHAAHPLWLGHARFHVVWQASTTALLAILQVVLLTWRGPMERERFYLAALLASLPIFGFFAAMSTRAMYGGALSDPAGIPPLNLMILGRSRRIDLNLVAEILGVALVAILVILYRH
jgi:hypothetical protein